jgi:hypothetical protein
MTDIAFEEIYCAEGTTPDGTTHSGPRQKTVSTRRVGSIVQDENRSVLACFASVRLSSRPKPAKL